MNKVPASELKLRVDSFKKNMSQLDPEWELAVIIGKINFYYFTGTMQNGAYVIPRESDPILFVRKSYDRAKIESSLELIYPIKSFKDILPIVSMNSESIYMEKEVLPLAVIDRFNKNFSFKYIKSLDLAVAKTRSVKSTFELDLMKTAGKIHEYALQEFAPTILTAGISEAEFGAKLLLEMIRNGHQGMARMGTFNAELYLGNICFGESGNYYNSFDGPAGIFGVSPAVPLFGNHNRMLTDNTIIMLDVGCGYEGYHTDKTAVYAYGNIPSEAYDLHQKCVEIQNEVAEMLCPGAIPSEIYEKVVSKIDSNFDIHFMGYGSNKVKFLGHGIGLVIDEYPVIAKGFDEPLEENMVLAVEPKKGIEQFGMVGIENTFIVTKNGGVSITGNDFNIIKL